MTWLTSGAVGATKPKKPNKPKRLSLAAQIPIDNRRSDSDSADGCMFKPCAACQLELT